MCSYSIHPSTGRTLAVAIILKSESHPITPSLIVPLNSTHQSYPGTLRHIRPSDQLDPKVESRVGPSPGLTL